jgi:hypothetical protein
VVEPVGIPLPYQTKIDMLALGQSHPGDDIALFLGVAGVGAVGTGFELRVITAEEGHIRPLRRGFGKHPNIAVRIADMPRQSGGASPSASSRRA